MRQAVLTADVIDSQYVENMDELFKSLKNIIHDVSSYLAINIKYETYRGDSFQVEMDCPEKAFLVALIIRAGLRAGIGLENKNTKSIAVNKLWDVRLSVAVGEGLFSKTPLVETNSPVHVVSGSNFDLLKKKQTTLLFSSTTEALNEQLGVLSKLLETIILRWSNLSAEVMYYVLLKNIKQQKLADKLGVSQPAIHKRLSIANVDTVLFTLDYLTKLIVK